MMFGSSFSARAHGSWLPPVDLAESEDAYRIIADLPNVKKEDLRVYTEGDRVVCISGKRLRATEEEQKRSILLLAERGFGSFVRCFELPTRVTEANAAFKDAQLTVDVPKVADTKGSTGSIKID